MTVLQARTYCDHMRKIEAAKTAGRAVRENIQLLAAFFGLTRRAVYTENLEDLMLAAKILHFVVQQQVLPKFQALYTEPVEPMEKSIFDDYDAEEDAETGWVDETQDRWIVCKQNIEAVTRLAIRAFKTGYADIQQQPLGQLLGYVAYEMQHKD